MTWIPCLGLALAALGAGLTAQDMPRMSPVPKLLELLRSEDRAVRKAAIGQLAIPKAERFFGDRPTRAVPSLLAIQAGADEELAQLATSTLIVIGPSPLGVFDFLRAEVAPVPRPAAEPETATAIRRALDDLEGSWFGRALVAPLERALADERLALPAIVALAALGDDASSATGTLLGQIDKDPRRSWRALYAISQVAASGTAASAPVLAALEDAAAGVRTQAIRAALRLAPGDERVVGALAALTKSADAGERSFAFDQLASLGPRAAPAVPTLTTLLASADRDARQGAVRALGATGPAAKGAIPRMLEVAQQDADARGLDAATFDWLAEMGPAASSAIPFLVERLRAGLRTNGSDQRAAYESWGAASALAKIDADVVIAELRAWLRGDSKAFGDITPGVGPTMVRVLGAPAGKLAPDVAALLERKEANALRLGLSLLAELGPAGEPALPQILAIIEGGDERLQSLAIAALVAMAPGVPKVVPILEKIFEQTADMDDRRHADCVRDVAPIGQAMVPLLRRALRDPDHWTRILAAESLLAIRPLPEGAIAATLPLLDDPHSIVPQQVIGRLGDVRPLPAEVRTAFARMLEERKEGVDLTTLANRLLTADVDPRGDPRRHPDYWNPGSLTNAAAQDPEHRPPITAVAGPPEEVTAWIASFAKAGEPETRRTVATGLRAPRRTGEVAIATLLELLADPEPTVVATAADALATHGPAARRAIPRLVERLRAGDWSAREAAARALREIQSH